MFDSKSAPTRPAPKSDPVCYSPHMKKSLLGMLLFAMTSPLLAQTLGTTALEVRDSSAAMLSTRAGSASASWGEQQALDDLRQLHQSSAALLEALSGNDASAVKPLQTELSSSARRLQASHSLLPDAGKDTAAVDELLADVAALDQRLTDLRLRFDQKAAMTPGPLADEPLADDDPAFDLYTNPQALLIDIRDLRRLVSRLQAGRNPAFGIGFNQPNNIDELQVRRLVLAAWDLENRLLRDYSDITETLPEWQKFRREYDRMGYPGTNEVVRQLERVVQRLTAFYDGVSVQ